MTHDPTDPIDPIDPTDHQDHEIPELFDRLESRVASPDPLAIRTEARRRGAARKRTLSMAGAFALVAAVAGGALWMSQQSTTEIAMEDGVGDDRADEIGDVADPLIFEFGAVAEDSAPRLQGTRLFPGRSLRNQMVGTSWEVSAVGGDSQGFVANSGYVIFNADPIEYGVPADIDSVLYVNGCVGSAYEVEWVETVARFEEPVELLQQSHVAFRVVSQLTAVPTAANANCVRAQIQPTLRIGEGITVGQAEGSDRVTMGHFCPPLAVCTPQGIWAVELTATGPADSPDPETAVETVVTIAECANGSSITLDGTRWVPEALPAEWEGQEQIDVTVEIFGESLIATDAQGNAAPFWDLEEIGRRMPCIGFNFDDPEDGLTLPEVSGFTFNAALNRLFELDLRTSRIDEASSNVPQGIVIRTNPPAGVEVDGREIITLVISSGPRPADPQPTPTSKAPADDMSTVIVPDVQALLADSARQHLTATGFDVLIEFVEVADPTQLNRVVSQTPAANVELNAGDAVTIVVGVTSTDD